VLGAGQLEVLAQHLEERLVHRNEDLAFLAVHGERQERLHPIGLRIVGQEDLSNDESLLN